MTMAAPDATTASTGKTRLDGDAATPPIARDGSIGAVPAGLVIQPPTGF
jgi:hypothetical protein